MINVGEYSEFRRNRWKNFNFNLILVFTVKMKALQLI